MVFAGAGAGTQTRKRGRRADRLYVRRIEAIVIRSRRVSEVALHIDTWAALLPPDRLVPIPANFSRFSDFSKLLVTHSFSQTFKK